MTSSTCCAACDEPPTVNGLWTTYKCFANSIQGFKPEIAVKTNGSTRRKREFTPDEQKDDNYWLKRSRNNEAAKRSRQRKRMEEYLLEARAVELLRENEKLKAALSAVHYHSLGVKYPLGTVTEYPLGQELQRDGYLHSLVDFSGTAGLTPLSETNSLPYYALSGRCGSDNQTQHFSSAYDSVSLAGMTTSPNIPTVAVIKNVRERGENIGNHLGIPSCHDGCSTLVPFAYEVSPRRWEHSSVLPTTDLSQNGYSGPLSLDGTKSNHLRLLAGPYGHGTHVLMDKPSTEDSAPTTTGVKDINEELKIIKQSERVPVRPLLPHKLRYKINKSKQGEYDWQITHTPGHQDV